MKLATSEELSKSVRIMRIISRKLKDAKTSTLSLQLMNPLKNNYGF